MISLEAFWDRPEMQTAENPLVNPGSGHHQLVYMGTRLDSLFLVDGTVNPGCWPTVHENQYLRGIFNRGQDGEERERGK